MLYLVLHPDNWAFPLPVVPDGAYADMQGLAVDPFRAFSLDGDHLRASVVVKVALFHREVKGI